MAFSERILIATDLSPASMLAVEAGAVLAKQFDAEVVLLYVYDPAMLGPMHVLPSAVTVLVDTKDAIPEFEKTVHEQLERVAKERLAGVPTKLVTLQNTSTAHAICDHAKSSGVDLIVVGTHGRTGLAHMLIGSVAEKVVRHAECPVLTLRSRAKD